MSSTRDTERRKKLEVKQNRFHRAREQTFFRKKKKNQIWNKK